MAQVKNYSEKDVSMMIETYEANPTRDTVEALAEKLGKNTRSVIAKLSREECLQISAKSDKIRRTYCPQENL